MDSTYSSDDDELGNDEFLARVKLARRHRISYLETYSICPPLNDGQNISYELSGLRQMVSHLERYRIHPTPSQERRIAGSKRVERYQLEHGHRKVSGKGQLFQSITAHPAISIRSFEELRVECYAESFMTQGKAPAPVDAVVSPEAVIPPPFNAYSDETDDVLPNEITMDS